MLANMTAPQCSEVQIEKSVMYLGDITQDRPSSEFNLPLGAPPPLVSFDVVIGMFILLCCHGEVVCPPPPFLSLLTWEKH